ncbi:MAG: sporulation protein YqfD [Clostridia bacterium]|nr:sporulation protein YqfD [Clostridia bacterium]
MLFSKIKISIETKSKATLFTEILKNELTYESVEFKGNNVILTIKERYFKKFDFVLKSLQLRYTISKKYGVNELLFLIFKRKGLLFGGIFLIFTLLISSKFVWQINVYGEEKMSKEEVLEELSQNGLAVGTSISSINYDSLHNKILLNSNKIAWISVNIDGNIANVNIKETKNEEIKHEEKYGNVVANKEGQICSIKLIEGEKVVKIGDIVKKGDLLISGIIDSQAQGVLYCKANGVVNAYTHTEIVVETSYVQTTKKYVSVDVQQKAINILGNNINFFIKHNKNTQNCDKIEIKKNLKLFNIDNLPIFLTQTKLYEYELIENTFTKEQAVDLAFIELRKKLDLALSDAELVSKEVSVEYNETGIKIICDLYCIENIAKKQEFYIN